MLPASPTQRTPVSLDQRHRGTPPRTDAELLPVLLELLGSAIPVEQWPTQLTKRERRTHSCRTAQSQATAADRGSADPPAHEVTRLPEQARTVTEAVDADRRHRREAAIRPESADTVPPRLGTSLRNRRLFLLPPDEDEVAQPKENA
jgi:hypothetical protein